MIDREITGRQNYSKVDSEKVYGILKRHLKDFDGYLGYVVRFLEKEKAGLVK